MVAVLCLKSRPRRLSAAIYEIAYPDDSLYLCDLWSVSESVLHDLHLFIEFSSNVYRYLHQFLPAVVFVPSTLFSRQTLRLLPDSFLTS